MFLFIFFFWIQYCKYENSYIFYWPISKVFSINSCFSGSSINAKQKFWGVRHLLHTSLSNRWLQVVLDGKSSQEYPVNAGVPQGSILCPSLFLLQSNLCKMTTFGTIQKWSFWAGVHLIKHLYKMTTSQI